MNASRIIKNVFIYDYFDQAKIINNIYKMGTIKQIDIKNRTYYFYSDIIELENFDSSLLKIDKNYIGHWYFQYWVYYN